MDCPQVRQQIVEGKAKRLAVRRHLQRCASCSTFHKQMVRVEEMLTEAIPFAAPDPLSQRLREMVPQAARDLRAAHRTAGGRIPTAAVYRLLYGLCLLAVPASLWVGYLLWRSALGQVLPEVGNLSWLLPLLPTAVLYWGGRLFSALAPLREALLFAASILLLGIALDQIRRARLQPAPQPRSPK
ncbi:MAG: hypothetical protein ACP5SI_06235 [Chloroflexia bacterium]